MLITRHVHCSRCRITYETQVEETQAQVDAQGNLGVSCYQCGSKAQARKPKRHETPKPFPDDTPHAHKSRTGGY